MPGVDVHQHLWPEGVLRALATRSEAPRARYAEGRWTVTLRGEPAFGVDPAQHDLAARAASVHASGLERALLALSAPVGIDGLPAGEARPLLDAWCDEARLLPGELGFWGAVSTDQPDGDEVDRLLDAGAAGVCVPANAVGTPAALERMGPVLDRLDARLAPLFIHPGPTAPGDGEALAPWWAPATDYVAQMHAAWHAFAGWGRASHPTLRVVHALLAGLAPLHSERIASRGGPDSVTREDPDPLVFYDTSSYGPRALRQMAARVGIGQLVHGTDHPVLAPAPGSALGADADHAMRTANVDRLLGIAWVAA